MKKSMIELHISVVIMSGTALFAKLITLPPTDIIAFRCLVAALTLLLFTRLAGTRLGLLRRADLGLLLLLGLLIAVHWVSFFAAVQMSGVTISLIAIYTFPVMTVLMEPFFFNERIDRRDLTVALIVLIGVYLAVPGGIEGGRIALGAALGIFSAFLYTLRNILYRKYLSRYPSSAMMFYQVAVAAVLLLPFVSPGIDLLTDHRWIYIIVLGVIFTAVSHTLFVDSLRTIRASTAGLIASLEPIYGMAFAVVVLSEIPVIKTVAGGIIVVGAAVYTSVRAGRTDK
ncbi:MAG: DMT family transporter [Deltaproteobacteria bacterium]|nr:DMT family transporter [Deltaproteobacteria bacterium]